MPVPHRTHRADHSAPRPDMARFDWQRCPVHGWYGVSVIVADGAVPWCIGDNEVAGHAVELPKRQAAARAS